LVTIVFSLHNLEKDFLDKFNDYNINFFTDKTVINYFRDKELLMEIKHKYLFMHPLLQQGSFDLSYSSMAKELEKKSIDTDDFLKEFNYIKNIQDSITPQYIPAERNLISLFNKYVTTFITADIPLPKFLLNFSSQYTRAREDIQQLKFLDVEYQSKNGQEHIFYNDKESLLLEHSSSGIQSAFPLYLTVKYFAKKHRSIIIEEPEQNLFPKAQKETVEYIVEQISEENKLFMMTHSPYVLTALNNLILANDVKTQKGLEAIEGIVKQEQCVAFEEVSAYSLVDGKSINIMDKEDRLIGVNLIDSISDEVSETFDKLLAKLD
jgi:hypothetical protein